VVELIALDELGEVEAEAHTAGERGGLCLGVSFRIDIAHQLDAPVAVLLRLPAVEMRGTVRATHDPENGRPQY